MLMFSFENPSRGQTITPSPLPAVRALVPSAPALASLTPLLTLTVGNNAALPALTATDASRATIFFPSCLQPASNWPGSLRPLTRRQVAPGTGHPGNPRRNSVLPSPYTRRCQDP